MGAGAPDGIAVIGAGSWGTALAVLLARHGNQVRLWGRDAGALVAMQRERRNARYLPDVVFPESLRPEPALDAALQGVGEVLLVVPSAAFSETLDRVARAAPHPVVLAWATKGLEPGTGRFLDELVLERLGPGVARALLSGPTFAGEVARGLPTAVTLAVSDEAVARRLAERFHGPDFRVYISTDLVGVQLGGAVKNVLAIAAGIIDGLGFGANARAALVTRGLAEITRLGVALGGHPETFTGLAGLGDLLLTCTDDQSRNRRFGLALARGLSTAQAEASVGQVVEGVRNTREAVRIARRAGVEMPIAEQVEQVLFHGVSPEAAVRALLARRPKHETD
jgi:glycerol-3-phosphate dehydrogenase (NAD(P)+)